MLLQRENTSTRYSPVFLGMWLRLVTRDITQGGIPGSYGCDRPKTEWIRNIMSWTGCLPLGWQQQQLKTTHKTN